ncbi:AraC family transcriptional regulator [Spartinivicinus poritis]|uniref:AraC family transcriptional regulator ligand-binding domain-containing protein n=1 Tax=Spartinivicinus poritis TaxID=2994640 RepID=A0ABT5U694_9GAMM|nr:AraC family transcriptional regulator [Spartinivicinus sp. A2-2]MDE1461889.1 AraC family transcriptional regulator ligand-binding domain-containing protein [Spartinivicinus sp. A2-2]
MHVAASYLESLFLTLEDYGIDRESFFKEIGISKPTNFGHICGYNGEQFERIILGSIAITGDSNFHLNIMKNHSCCSCDIVGLMALSAPTLGKAIQVFIQYYNEFMDIYAPPELIVRSNTCELISPKLIDHVNIINIADELRVSSWVYAIKMFIRSHPTINEIWFTHPAPINHTQYEGLFQCPVYFDMNQTKLLFPSVLLSYQNSNYNEDLFLLLLEEVHKQKVVRKKTTPLSEYLYDLFLKKPEFIRMPVKHVANQLKMSERTLQRKLQAEGSSYKKISSKAFSYLAKKLLKHTSLPVKTIAFDLCFNSQQNFNHAFRAATGLSPKQYRELELATTKASGASPYTPHK